MERARWISRFNWRQLQKFHVAVERGRARGAGEGAGGERRSTFREAVRCLYYEQTGDRGRQASQEATLITAATVTRCC